MNYRLLPIFVFSFFTATTIFSQEVTDPKATEVWDPEPRVVSVGTTNSAPPSDAIILFDGSTGDHWCHYDSSELQWTIADGILTCKPGSGTIKTKEVFGDCQLHIEWSSPLEPSKKGQDKGNSGIFFQNKYEIQILNSYENRTYSNGQAGAIYKQSPPLVNAMRQSMEWNTYDIVFHAPLFDENGVKTKSATMTAFHNGVLIQDNFEIQGTTEYIGPPKNMAHGDGSIVLQDHSNYVRYRNIWLRKL
ncbi:MAG: hypothetical protein ACI86M_000847 [Saprospiraceae bacterium]|jgi:hypothetical protein